MPVVRREVATLIEMSAIYCITTDFNNSKLQQQYGVNVERNNSYNFYMQYPPLVYIQPVL